MRSLAVSALILFGLSGVVQASGEVYCATKQEDVGLSIGLGRVPIYAPLNAYAWYKDTEWSTNPENGQKKLDASQGLFEENRFAADFVDIDDYKIIISLRVDMSDEIPDGFPGTLTFEDGVEHEVLCAFG